MGEPTAAAARVYVVFVKQGDDVTIAEIDREAGLPELIAACEKSRELMLKLDIQGDALRAVNDALRIAKEGRP